MAFQYSHQAGRHCIRCDKQLTDAASMEVGVGPICRKLDNAILAQSIPANVEQALNAFAGIPADQFSAVTVHVLNEVLQSLMAGGKTDWRKEVKQMEWLLSYEDIRKVAFKPMLAAVQALGYVGLASLWAGEASTGLATVRFENGRLYVNGPMNKYARYALKRIPNCLFHGATKEWSVPAHAFSAFEKAIHAHYPVNTGLSEALAAAKLHSAPVAAPVAAPAVVSAPVSPRLVVEAEGGVLKVITPYKATFVAALKSALPYNARRWDGVAKHWVVEEKFRTTVLGLIVSHYNELPEVRDAASVSEGGIKVTTLLDEAKPFVAPANTLPF